MIIDLPPSLSDLSAVVKSSQKFKATIQPLAPTLQANLHSILHRLDTTMTIVYIGSQEECMKVVELLEGDGE